MMMTKNVKIILVMVMVMVMVGFLSAQALAQEKKPESTKLIVPLGGTTEVTNIGQYIETIYRLGLGLGGLFAMLFIVYGGILYTASAGNPSKQGEAKDIITNALWGLALLFGAFLILNTIDPRLTKLELPGLAPVKAPQVQQVDTHLQQLRQEVTESSNTAVDAQRQSVIASENLLDAEQSGDALRIAQANLDSARARFRALNESLDSETALLGVYRREWQHYDSFRAQGQLTNPNFSRQDYANYVESQENVVQQATERAGRAIDAITQARQALQAIEQQLPTQSPQQ